ncbi:tetratricopeptide repeat protein [Gramella sp. AN32]|uniref:Tetratricopeptide repeat protein n=1 Tax=Christiangramia antarctica TaxID=2058158 RepID=A0ABW5X794_9FLAO|nr:tetratricopeptide repeat protein [Gramella sp. AN32]
MKVKIKLFIGIFLHFTCLLNAQEYLKDGENLLRQGKISEAEKIFLEHPNNEKSREFLGDIASFNKEWDKAIEYYEELLEEHPNNATYNFKTGGSMGMKAYYGSKFQAMLLIGDIKTYLRRAAELDKNHTEVRRALVELYVQLPGFIGGSDVLAESYASDLDRLNQIDALLADGYIYRKKDYRDLAKSKFQEALQVSRRKPELLTRNYMKYELGEFSALFEVELDQGEKMLKEYIADYGYKDLKIPSWAYLRLAQIERARNNQEKAVAYIDKSLNIDPKFDKALEEKTKISRM